MTCFSEQSTFLNLMESLRVWMIVDGREGRGGVVLREMRELGKGRV